MRNEHEPREAGNTRRRVLFAKAGMLASWCIGLGLMGFTFGPLGTSLSELFPTAVRYTGASLAFNLAGILGASIAPYVATWLAGRYGLAFVGYYLSVAGALTLLALLLIGPATHASPRMSQAHSVAQGERT
jgi:hypothetical protein